MAIDYFILTMLKLIKENGETTNVELYRQAHYFKDVDIDSDDETYDETLRYEKLKIKVPIIIVEDGKFKREIFLKKYKNFNPSDYKLIVKYQKYESVVNTN